jgi:hypothetical protein
MKISSAQPCWNEKLKPRNPDMVRKTSKTTGRDRKAEPARPTSVDAKKYNAVVAAANLSAVILMRSNFEMDAEYLPANISREKRPKFTTDWNFVSVDFDADEGIATGIFQFDLRVKFGRKNLLKISSSYLVAYDDLFNHDEEIVSVFLKRVGRFAAYPYFRALVSQYSWSSEANLPVLPIIHT